MLPLSFKEIMEYYVAGSWMKYCVLQVRQVRLVRLEAYLIIWTCI